MRSFVNNFSTLWLVLALIVAPLQAAASPAPADRAVCPMQQAHGHATGGMHHATAASHAPSRCAHCCPPHGHGCDHGKCDGLNGCSAHAPLGMSPAAFVFCLDAAAALHPPLDKANESLPPSPLYRPPV